MSVRLSGKSSKALRRRTSAADRFQKLSLAKSFVPKMLIESVNQILELDPRFELYPHSMFFEAIVLLVDISGFTRLSGQYCARGKDGIDDLQKATNGFIGKLVEIIYYYGGDIIKFAGDAIICIFSTPEVHNAYYRQLVEKQAIQLSNFSRSCSRSQDYGAADDPVIELTPHKSSTMQQQLLWQSDLPSKALQCALELSRAETDQLTVHVALSAGEICYAVMGGFNDIWECLISGECISHISDCLDDAKSREVVVTPQFAQMLPDDIRSSSNSSNSSNRSNSSNNNGLVLVPLPSGNIRAEATKVQQSDESLREKSMQQFSASRDVMCDSAFILQQIVKFVPYPIIQSMQSDFQHLAEVREVSTMFMKWDSYATADHRDLMSLQDLFADAQEILSESGAFVRQFLVDDKGCVLIACWGVPTASYVDNAVRALSTAVKLRKAFSASEFNSSYGITTGNVYCGTIGSHIRREYAAIGDVVNLSARLMSKAAGKVFIDEATFKRLPFKVAQKLTQLSPIMVKGKPEPIPIYCYSSKQLLVLEEVSTADFMIREAHKNQLLGALDIISPQSLSDSLPFTESASSGGRSMNKRANKLERIFGASTHEVTATFFLVEGKSGTGKTSLTRWFSSEVDRRGTTCHTVVLTPVDHAFEFRAVSLLFHQIVGEEVMSNVEAERAQVMKLLDAIHPEDVKGAPLARRKMLSVMQLALHVSSGISLKPEGNSALPGIFVAVRGDSNSKGFEDRTYMIHALKLILAELLKAENAVVVIENIHLADANSIRVFEVLSPTMSKSIMLFTALDIVEVPTHINSIMAPTPKAHSPGGAGKGSSSISRRGSTSIRSEVHYEVDCSIYEVFRQLLLGHKGMIHITLTNFTPAEIEAMLCKILQQRSVPQELVKLIHHMSNGDAFWVREMIDFVLTAGVEEFLDTMDEGESNQQRIASPSGAPTALMDEYDSDNENPKLAGQLSAIREEHSKTDLLPGDVSVAKRSPPKQLPLINVEANKLHAFTICRFELLSADEQQILKIASVFGVDVDYAILCRVLPGRMQGKAAAVTSALTAAHWLSSVSSDPPMLKFMHELPRRVIYELIPTSGRIELHKAITQSILAHYCSGSDSTESSNNESSSRGSDQYLTLATHFRMFDEQKTLQYYCLAAQHIIAVESETGNWIECQRLLTTAAAYCKTTVDCEVVMNLVAQAIRAVFADTFAVRSRPNAVVAPIATKSRSPFKWFICGSATSQVVPRGSSATAAGADSLDVKVHRRKRHSIRNSVISDNASSEIIGRFQRMEQRLEARGRRLFSKNGVAEPCDWQRVFLDDGSGPIKRVFGSVSFDMNSNSERNGADRDGVLNSYTRSSTSPMSANHSASSDDGRSGKAELKEGRISGDAATCTLLTTASGIAQGRLSQKIDAFAVRSFKDVDDLT